MIGLTVCVNYSDYLSQTLEVWSGSLSEIIVITDLQDWQTVQVAQKFGNVSTFSTDRFYENGASFNKAGAMNQAIETVRGEDDFICIFDSDILPPMDWKNQLPRLDKNMLYGAHRWEKGERLNEKEFPGYFWIFHLQGQRIPKRPNPMFTEWKHAGGFDSDFQSLWPRHERIRLDIRLLHLGTNGQNWWGRGTSHKMKEMYQKRREVGTYDHERMKI